MKQAMLHGPCDLRIEEMDLDIDNLAPDQIWVQTEVTALSTGTDRGNYEGAEQIPDAPTYPRRVGYSNVGRVQAIGSAVERFQVGDRVFAIKPHISDYIASEMDAIVKVPDQISAEEAVFAKLYHLGFHSLAQGQFEWGKNIAVVRLGF
jgi:threonine dehydrogenase-like Zn-dependent dehydrogenase